jgi:hypothetical protein
MFKFWIKLAAYGSLHNGKTLLSWQVFCLKCVKEKHYNCNITRKESFIGQAQEDFIFPPVLQKEVNFTDLIH